MSELAIQRVCVVGRGETAIRLAAHLANLKFDVTLLEDSQATALASLERARASRPPLFYVPERANDVRIGNVVEHRFWITEADWICEMSHGPLETKRSSLAAIAPFLRPDALLTTDLGGLQAEVLATGLSDETRRNFFGAQFSSSPRYTKLLELVPTSRTDVSLTRDFQRFAEARVGRRVVVAKDSPGAIVHRFGTWTLLHAIHVAEKLHLDTEFVEAITGPFLGARWGGVYTQSDRIGLDEIRGVAHNLSEELPDAPYRNSLRLPSSILTMLARGWTGDGAGHGYYRHEGRERLVLDRQTFAYRPLRDEVPRTVKELASLPLGERIRHTLSRRDEAGEYLREYLVPCLRYADALKAEVSHSVQDFDRVMRWGFGWELGPFALIDAIGAEHLGIAEGSFFSEGRQRAFGGGWTPKVAEPEYRPLASFAEVGRGKSYVLRDLGDGVTSLGLNLDRPVVTPAVVDELTALLKSPSFDRFVLTSETATFSAGYDLRYVAHVVQNQTWTELEANLANLQRLGELLEKKQCVAAVRGSCLGTGLELALSCPQIVVTAECQIGFPESRAGLIPAGRGVTLMRMLNGHSAQRASEAALSVIEGAVATNADLARQRGFLRASDVTCYLPDRLLHLAKQAVLAAVPNRLEWRPIAGPLVGMIDRGTALRRQRGLMTAYDETIGVKVRQIFARSTSYEDSLARERLEMLDLCSRALTQARVRHLLETGKPLHN